MSHFIIVPVLISLIGLSNQTNWTIADNSNACLYGWQLNENGSACSINCFIDKYGSMNVDCSLHVLTQLKTSYKDMTLYMSPGKQLTNSSQLSYCYNVTLNSQQFSLTPDGQLDLGNGYMQIGIFNLSKNKESASFCYPLSPQLLQCPNDVTDHGDYQIINSTKLHIPSKNITAYLGDFYILSNGSAVTCEHNIKNNTDMPRCNYITVQTGDINLNSDGSVLITTANFIINNPVYSVATSNSEVKVCFPLSLEMLNCKDVQETVVPFVDILPNLHVYSVIFHYYFKPDSYYVNSFDSWKNISKIPTVNTAGFYSISCVKVKPKTQFAIYSLYGWGLPAVMLTTILLINLLSSPFNFNNTYIPYFEPLWTFNTPVTFYVYWGAPECLFSATTFIFACLIIKNIKKAASGIDLVNERSNAQIFLMSGRIIFVMGFISFFIVIMNILLLVNEKLSEIQHIRLSNQENWTIANNSNACLYGWQLSENGSTCSIHCFTDKYESMNVDCSLHVLTQLKTSYNDMMLYMSPGKQLTNSSQLSYCYNVTLNSQQFSLTPDGQLDLGNRYIQISIFNLSKVKESVSFCYPLSPQLLQCPNHVTNYGDYQIINSTKLLIPSKNITAYLGDFYILSNGSAVTCEQNIKNNTDMPRCNYITVQTGDINLNSDGSVLITTANFIINNPVYSVATSNSEVKVCFPLSLEMLNCPNVQETIVPFVEILHDLHVYSVVLHYYFKPDSYYVNSKSIITFCNEDSLSFTPVVTNSIVVGVSSFAASTILLVVVLFRRKFFLQNYHCKCLMCHIIMGIINCIFWGVKMFVPYLRRTPCYIIFSVYYYTMMSYYAWLNVMGFDSWKNISKIPTVNTTGFYSISCVKVKPKTQFAIYSLYGWGLPAVMLTTILLINLLSSPFNFNNTYIPYFEPLWGLNSPITFNIYWAAPECLFSATTFIFACLIIKNMKKAGSGVDLVNERSNAQIFSMSGRIIFVMGFISFFILIINIGLLVNENLSEIQHISASTAFVLQIYTLAFIYRPQLNIMIIIRKLISKCRRY
ncbi:hypothetical protein CHUAL_011154 [Chamberlinius hualienensis]